MRKFQSTGNLDYEEKSSFLQFHRDLCMKRFDIHSSHFSIDILWAFNELSELHKSVSFIAEKAAVSIDFVGIYHMGALWGHVNPFIEHGVDLSFRWMLAVAV
jgi:hypothetical protein